MGIFWLQYFPWPLEQNIPLLQYIRETERATNNMAATFIKAKARICWVKAGNDAMFFILLNIFVLFFLLPRFVSSHTRA